MDGPSSSLRSNFQRDSERQRRSGNHMLNNLKMSLSFKIDTKSTVTRTSRSQQHNQQPDASTIMAEMSFPRGELSPISPMKNTVELANVMEESIRPDGLPVKPIRFSFKHPSKAKPLEPEAGEVSEEEYISFKELEVDSKRKRNPLFEVEEEAPKKWQKRAIKSKDVLSSLPDPPWNDGKRYSSNLTLMLHEEIVDYAAYIAPRPEEHEMRRLAVDRVATVAKKIWPNCQIHIFGSFDTQIYLPSSDIDMVIVDPAARPPGCLYALADGLQRDGVCQQMEVISKARVPIVKIVDAITQYPVDISFNMTSGVDSAEIVKELLNDSTVAPAVKPLILVLKQFLVQRGQNEVYSGGLGSYGLLMMVMSFLKMHPLLQSGQMRPEENLGVLLLEFLELHGRNFNYDGVGMGLDARKGVFYYDKQKRGWDVRTGSLSIQDPQDKDNDITRGSFAFYAVRQEFNRAFTLLTAMINAHTTRVLLRRPVEPVNTLLSSIVRVKRVTEEHRIHIKKTWLAIQQGHIQPGVSNQVLLNSRPQPRTKQGHIVFVSDDSEFETDDVSSINVVDTRKMLQTPDALQDLVQMYGNAADILASDNYQVLNGLPIVVDRKGQVPEFPEDAPLPLPKSKKQKNAEKAHKTTEVKRLEHLQQANLTLEATNRLLRESVTKPNPGPDVAKILESPVPSLNLESASISEIVKAQRVINDAIRVQNRILRKLGGKGKSKKKKKSTKSVQPIKQAKSPNKSPTKPKPVPQKKAKKSPVRKTKNV